MKYSAYGLVIESEIPLTALLPLGDDTPCDLHVRHADLSIRSEELRNAGYYFSVINEECYWVHYEEVGSFLIENGRSILADLEQNGIPSRAESVITGFCMGALLYQRKEIGIHGGCILKDEKAWMICGKSGSGKSTLVTELMKGKNVQFMADDMVRLNQNAEAYASFPRQKLCLDLAERMNLDLKQLELLNEDRMKFGYGRTADFCNEKKQLQSMFILKIGDALEMKKVTGFKKLEALYSQLYPEYIYRLLPLQEEQVKQCMQLVSKINIFEITRPDGVNTAEEQVRLMESAQ